MCCTEIRNRQLNNYIFYERASPSLTVRLLVSGTGTGSTELLGLTTTRISNEQASVILNKQILDLLLGGLIDVLLVPGNNSLGDGLTDGVDLSSVTWGYAVWYRRSDLC